ncbi:DinB family protein [Candidatus Leptofilum sp.]|uniref:DinB family protein n=1 Tax=Candidatus Leptofilum sp. TaxID=3241576 RepID=UPI003B5A5A42
MFNKTQFNTLFAYHWHITQQLLDKAKNLSEADLHDNPGYAHGSIFDLFFHLLQTDIAWRKGLESGKQQSGVEKGQYPDLAAIEDGFAAEAVAWQAVLDGYTAVQIEGNIDLINWRGDKMTFPLWHILQHVVFHGMQHHAELAQLLTNKGQSPGNIDLLFFRG